MSLDFTNNDTDKVDYGSDASIDNFMAFTFWAWVYADSGTNNSNAAWFSKVDDSNVVRKVFHQKSTNPLTMFLRVERSTVSAEVETGNELTADAWNFLACTFSIAAGMDVYNGTLTQAATKPTYTSDVAGSGTVMDDDTLPFWLGNWNQAVSPRAVNGRIAVFGYHNAVLPLEQVVSLQWNPRVMSSTRLFSYPGFNGIGDQPDWSGNGNNGIVTGATVADHVPLPPPFGLDTPALIIPGAVGVDELGAQFNRIGRFCGPQIYGAGSVNR